MKTYLSIDIGASSGRHILFEKGDDGKLSLTEIYRFKTALIHRDGHDYWDIEKLFSDVLAGLRKAKEARKIPERIGIDTFGVDYALLNSENELTDGILSYRDNRTAAAKKRFLTPKDLYFLTGIQPHEFDTAYQLYSDRETGRLQNAVKMILLPSYLAYLLTGVMQNERSILSTTALLDSRTEDYSPEVLKALGLERSFFAPLIEPGEKIGAFRSDIAGLVGYQSDVYAALEHDTASAFLGSEAHAGEILLSSGTWSLLGTFLSAPIINDKSLEDGFTNEFSRKGEIRFLKNIMGMWLINRLEEEIEPHLPIQEIVKRAREGRAYVGVFDAAEESLLNPRSMEEAVIALLAKGGYSRPRDVGELCYSVYHSLAIAYAKAIEELSALTGRRYEDIVVFGGGSQNELLNELTEQVTGLKVRRGPVEATAIGNVLSIG
jgi:rhamnulokinase